MQTQSEIDLDALASIEKTKTDMLRDLTPLIGEKFANECVEHIVGAILRATKKRYGIKDN